MLEIKKVARDIEQANAGTLYKSLLKWTLLRPNEPYVIEAETGRELTFAQTLAAVNELRQFFGTTPRCIMLAFPSGIANAVIWLSALAWGHQLIPLSPESTTAEKAALIQKYQPDIFCTEDISGVFDTENLAHMQILTLQECTQRIVRAAARGQIDQFEQSEGHVCLTTSGTTGEPKTIVLQERQIAWTAAQVCHSHQLTTHDRGLTVLPFFHVNAPVVSLCASLLAGATIVIARHFSLRAFWLWVEQYQVTWVSIVPTITFMLLKTEKPAFLPGAVRFMRTGSSALPAHNLQAFEARFGIPLIETYGLSEAASQVTANPLPPAAHKPGSAGLPVGVDLRICYPREQANESGLCDVPQGSIGEICITGPGVVGAYQHNVAQDAFQSGWFRTGDLGYLDQDGYLFIQGRLREIIIRGGENIIPREIEDVLLLHPAVHEVAAVGRPDDVYGEQVVAYIVVAQEWTADLAEELHQFALQRLNSAKVPVECIPLTELPKNATGKIDRRLLHERELEYARPSYANQCSN